MSTVPPPDERVTSIDALRGFDMFWIIGGEAIAHSAAKLTGWGWLVWLSQQLEHPEWNGFTFYDLVFPLFLFLAGVSMPFSFQKRLGRGDTRSQLVRHVVVRGLVLVLLGAIYNGMLEFDWPHMRLPSVLGRIGLAYLAAGLIVLFTTPRGQWTAAIALLVAYWAALKFIPVPHFGAGDLAPGHTLTDWVDRMLIPGELYKGDRDPEGLFGVIPATATCLAGVLAGHLLRNSRYNG
jgi:predicted acyltransferase